ncbi:MAG: sulfatase-like hydrolase/transferase [Bacteroidota bacterium]
MIKNIISFLWVALAVAVFLGCNEQPDKEIPKPNILWIVSEDNSPFIGAYGDEFSTTPVLDSFAKQGVLFENAFATAPVCAPARSTLITGMYANSLGTHQMRSWYQIPEEFRFFPSYLQDAGYYCTNNSKKDYNTIDQPEAWNESSNEATYRNRKPGQPFFHVQNIFVSHESSLHDSIPWEVLRHDPEQVPIPPYHPRTPEMKHDWAQYYDKIEDMDSLVGQLLQQLEKDGLKDSTIVFYYSDHGGVLGRSKRYMYESGLRVPLIVHFPEMYKDLLPESIKNTTDRLVSFVDFPATVLSLAGVDVPEHFQGKPFFGAQEGPEKDYVFGFRGRMDEKIDMSRSVRNKQYRYIRNYMPHKVYGQYLEYLWRAPSMRSWEKAYYSGELNEIQEAFFKAKPAEELYDIKKDPFNINNLAKDPEYENVMLEMRKQNQEWIYETRDAGFLPEPMMARIAQDTPVFRYMRSPEVPFEKLVETADMASSRDKAFMDEILDRLNDGYPAIRYWAVIGCIVLEANDAVVINKLQTIMKDDPEISVRIAAAEALYRRGEKEGVIQTLSEALDSDIEMTRLYALNVLEMMGEEAFVLKDKIQALIIRDPDTKVYDLRVAMTLMDFFRKEGLINE